MNGDRLTLVGVIIISLLGTTGLTGLLSGGIEIGARNRLRKRVERALDLRDRFKPRTPEWNALYYAAQLDSIRLASLSAVGLRYRLKSTIGSFVAAAVLYVLLGIVIVTGGDLQEQTSYLGLFGTRLQIGLTFAAATLTISVLFALLLESSLRRGRRTFVTKVLAGRPIVEVVAESHK